MTLTNSEINLFLAWSSEFNTLTRTANNQERRFAVTDTKSCLRVVTLSIKN